MPASRVLKIVALPIVLWWLAAAAILPAIQDEAYYVMWGRYLGFGYFDHPPLVALITQTARLLPGSALAARLGTLLVAIATLLVADRLCRRVGLIDERARAATLLMGWGNLLGLLLGFLATFDTLLVFFWTLALHESAAALTGNPRRWLTAGAAVGLGLLSKYMMVLFFPVAVWALVAEWRACGPRRQRPAMATPWPWAGAIVALLVFSPNLAWNAANDWITIRFQAHHALRVDAPLVTTTALPGPLPAAAGGVEDELSRTFSRGEQAPLQPARPRMNAFLDFWVGQVLLWGFILVVVVTRPRWRRASPPAASEAEAPGRRLEPVMATLVHAAAVVPLVFFGLVSLVSSVEANWPVMYVIGAALWLAPRFAEHLNGLGWAVVANAMLLTAGLVQSRTGFLPVPPDLDRVLKETHGFESLAQTLSELKGPVFADSYQIAAQTSFHRPGLMVRQWPGIGRDSEFVRNPALNDLTLGDLQRAGAFWLVLTALPVPRLPQFSPDTLAQLRDCRREGLQRIASDAPAGRDHPCDEPIHIWYLARYRPATARESSAR